MYLIDEKRQHCVVVEAKRRLVTLGAFLRQVGVYVWWWWWWWCTYMDTMWAAWGIPAPGVCATARTRVSLPEHVCPSLISSLVCVRLRAHTLMRNVCIVCARGCACDVCVFSLSVSVCSFCVCIVCVRACGRAFACVRVVLCAHAYSLCFGLVFLSS